ncbi:MAG: MBL fold metallo-hydrolase [Candidatus Omnitrophota bacterium]
MDYILETIVVGPLGVNCYLLGCKTTLKAVIIDPGADDDKIKRSLIKKGLSAVCVINTHGHGDHIGANSSFDLPIFIHKNDEEFLTNPAKNFSLAFGMRVFSPPAARLLDDGEKITVGDLSLEVIHTPGHTPGSISIKCADLVFTGDTLFNEGVGRTDFPYGSEADLFKAIKERLLVLPDSTKVYPGHGPSTTIGYEKQNNPFITDR